MLVRKIITQSTVDGPGNRVAVFLQGCNIRCAYCHNPETQSMHDAEAVEMSVSEVVAEVAACMPFIRGVTVSGGECMLQAEWLQSLFCEVKRLGRLTCLIDSNGTIDFSRHEKLMQVCDGVMLDVKAWDNEVYSRLTSSKSNDVVKRNLLWLLEHDKLTEVRIVCLPEQMPISTDVDNILRHLSATAGFREKAVPTRLLRFRPHGVVGALADYPMPSDEQMKRHLTLAQQLGLSATVK